jgi:MSHA pilin protein MshA
MKRQQGFTLIELVVVIIILGILAVTAAPRFINLQTDARISALEGARGALQSANSLVLSRAVLNGQGNAANQVVVLIPANGGVPAVEVRTDFGYLNVTNNANILTNLNNSLDMTFETLANANVATLVTTADWGVFRVNGTTIRIVPNGRSASTVAANACHMEYTEAANAATGPVYTMTAAMTTGC